MTSFIGGVGAGVLCGLIAYGALRFLFPDLAPAEQTNVIGAVAVIGAVVTAVVARRLSPRDEH